MWKIFKWFLDWITEYKYPHVVPPVSGGFPALPVINNVEGWDKYLSRPFENQWQGFDEDNCATRSAVECIEAVFNYYLMNHLINPHLEDFLRNQFCNDQGYVKISVRYNAQLNHTTHQGVSLDTVWNNFGTYGIIPEKYYPDPASPFSWNNYYSEIPQNVLDYGKAMVNTFQVQWQVIQNNMWTAPDLNLLKTHLKGSPLQFASGVGLMSGGVEQPPSVQVYQHARTLFGIDNYLDVLDSEGGVEKELSLNFPLACLIKVGLNFDGNGTKI